MLSQMRNSLYLLTAGVCVGAFSYRPITYFASSIITDSINNTNEKHSEHVIYDDKHHEIHNSLKEMRKKIHDYEIKECTDRCNVLKKKLTEYYKTNVFDVLPCKKPYQSKEAEIKYIGTDEHQDSFILEDVYNVMNKYNDSYMNTVRQHENMDALINMRNKLMRIHDASVRYPKVQYFILDLVVNHYKLL